MNVYICRTCGGEFTAKNDTHAEEAQRLHRLENKAEHLNKICFPPMLKS